MKHIKRRILVRFGEFPRQRRQNISYAYDSMWTSNFFLAVTGTVTGNVSGVVSGPKSCLVRDVSGVTGESQNFLKDIFKASPKNAHLDGLTSIGGLGWTINGAVGLVVGAIAPTALSNPPARRDCLQRLQS